VIVSGHGAPAEVVAPSVNGFHFRPGDAADLAHVLEGAFAARASWTPMSQAARQEFEAKYHSAAGYDSLMRTYRIAMSNRDRCEVKRRKPLLSE
jgi:glycosyltransferase involved in cell wall biosynthesis